MATEILISKSAREARVARIENGHLVELSIERAKDRGIVGNIYKGRVARVLPGMQAAFIDMGLARTGFLYVSNVLNPADAKDDATEEFDGDNATADEEPEENSDRPPPQTDISQLIHEGETLLVQVVKEPMGTKGARLSGYVSLPGRYLVYLPDTRQLGISRRIENQEERERLRQIIEKNRPAQGGFIVRTVAEHATEKHLKDDMDYLVKLWGSTKKAAEKQPVSSLVYADLDLPARVLRDRVTDDVDRILVDDLATYKQMTKFIQSFLPRFKKRIELHTDKTPLFHLHGIETEITRAIARKVWLKSGGYIIIDETEALTTIDVNTGRFVGRGRNLEDTILQTNLEAVKEIAYQIRLRNLGGIIVLDFIDMDRQFNRERIYQALLEELRKDPVRTNVLPISQLGLIEMTRKRTQESLRQKLTSPCQYCEGRGYVKSRDSIAYEIVRECQREAMTATSTVLVVYCHPAIAELFTDEERGSLEELEKRISRRISIKTDGNLHLEEYEIFARDE